MTRTRNYVGVAAMGGWEIAEETDFLDAAEACRERSGRDVHREAARLERPARPHSLAVARDADDSRDRRARDGVDRIVGYEANYAGTSFVKIVRHRQAQVRLEAVQHHGRQDRQAASARAATTTTA